MIIRVLFLLINIQFIYSVQQSGFFELVGYDKKLPGYVIEQEIVESKAECGQLCLMRNCYSYNIDNENVEKKLCEVNSESLQLQGTSLTGQTGTNYHQLVPNLFNVHASWYHGNTGNIYVLTDNRMVYIYVDENSLHKPPMQVTNLDSMLPSMPTGEIDDIQFYYSPTTNYTRVFEGGNLWLYEDDIPHGTHFPSAASLTYGTGTPEDPDAVFMTDDAYFLKNNNVYISNSVVYDSYDIMAANPTKDFQNVPVTHGITAATETVQQGVFLFFENSAFVRYDNATKLYTNGMLHAPK
ncbi:unnamed protein product [Owenia fusiformis]|uniref:Uncharacterized protein n=1 Tax=Owenia fusiformis TaxID=6347 RepID=A0A8S4PSJ5_OWEFU|nr:unnamed protein product [Owenia fusiformis]